MNEKTKGYALTGVSIFAALTVFAQIREVFVTQDQFTGIATEIQRNADFIKTNKDDMLRLAEKTDFKIKDLEHRIISEIEKSGERVIKQVSEKIEYIEKFRKQNLKETNFRTNIVDSRAIDMVRSLDNRLINIEKALITSKSKTLSK